MQSQIRNIGVITSGGDSPGMNACMRSVVRSASVSNINIIGFYRGFEGLLNDDSVPLTNTSVANIIQLGGTILKTARSLRFYDSEERKKAYLNLKKHKIDALVVIGGDGSFAGASKVMSEFNIPVIGLPGTIDNDLYGTDYTIGYDTAINTVVQAVDKIRDTAMSHDRIFVVEVMGRDAGFIALRSGIAAGAQAILVPETSTDIGYVFDKLASRRKDKASAIIMVSEGDDFGGGREVADAIKGKFPQFDVKLTVLGHIQRGGSPSAMDRVLASQLGYGAIQALIDGKSGCMVGMVDKKITYTPIDKAIKHHQKLNADLLNIAEILSL
jgi:6-phosphofructokinase 1